MNSLSPDPSVENVYLREARRLDPHIDGRDRWALDPAIVGWDLRRQLQRRFAWAIPDAAAIAAIAAWSPLVEIGAGTGYWAQLLAAAGADVVAYDIQPGRNSWCESDCYHPVHVGDWRTVRRHADRALMLCWPPMNRLAEKALRAYRGDRVIYIGEHHGGCCAEDRFFERLDRDWHLAREIAIPQWWGLHDAVFCYRRTETR